MTTKPTFTDRATLIRETPRPIRQAALALLDDLTTPLHPRVIDRLLQDEGLSRTDARRLTRVLKKFDLIAMTKR
jgi:hypothetical protein